MADDARGAATRAGISEKVEHVRAAAQTRSHVCHWPGCDEQVPPARWGCRAHWYHLPRDLRRRIWAAYEPGQEASLTPSREYLRAARAVQAWIEQHGTAVPPSKGDSP